MRRVLLPRHVVIPIRARRRQTIPFRSNTQGQTFVRTGQYSRAVGRLMSSAGDGKRFLWIAIVVGLLARLAILWHTQALGTEIVDEQQYSQLGHSLLAGDGLAWAPGESSSIRPPLYPALLATIWSVAGPHNLQAVRVFQILLALATMAVVYLLGARLYNQRIARYAAAACWLYPSLLFFNFLILTETLFTLLLLTFVLLTVVLVQAPRAWAALLCGISLGLAALTRSVLWPVPLVLCPLLSALIRAPIARRVALPLIVLAGYAIVVAPWAIRNTRLQGVVTIVDTMGGMNLRMGNYEFTPDDRMWEAVALRGERSWVYGVTPDRPGEPMTEGRKEKWAQRKALEYMRQHPTITLRRSLIKFADFWGLEREFIAGIAKGLYAPPPWFQVLASLVIVCGYVLVVATGVGGMWLAAPEDRRMQMLLLLPIVVLVGAHTIVFGHSRYHLPLMPIFAIYGAALTQVRPLGLARRSGRAGAMLAIAALFAIWIREVALVDASRIGALLDRLG
jgi:4-amino-4-deoxy-L-arabinose transferase-like glycosyltransferase